MGTAATVTGTWMTPANVAAALGVKPATVYRAFHAGDIPGHKIRSAYRIPAAFVAGLLAVIDGGGQVNVATFGRQWRAPELEAAGSPQ